MAPRPADRLGPPNASAPLPDVLTSVLGFTQYISPSYWAGVIMDHCFGRDPFQWVAEEFTGDWRAVQAAGAALKNLAAFNADTAVALRVGTRGATTEWEGQASGAAGSYFTDLAAAIERQQQDLLDAGEQFEQIAFGMNRWTATVRGLLLTLSDFLVAAVVSAAATAAAGVTVIGAVLGAAATAASITKVMSVWGQIVGLHGYVVNSVNGMLGLAAGYGSSLRGLEQHGLPAAGYDNAAV